MISKKAFQIFILKQEYAVKFRERKRILKVPIQGLAVISSSLLDAVFFVFPLSKRNFLVILVPCSYINLFFTVYHSVILTKPTPTPIIRL